LLSSSDIIAAMIAARNEANLDVCAFVDDESKVDVTDDADTDAEIVVVGDDVAVTSDADGYIFKKNR
jgi:hypothetical protein